MEKSSREICRELKPLFAGKAGIIGFTTYRRSTSPVLVWVEGKSTPEQEQMLAQVRKKAGNVPIKVFRTGSVANRRSSEGMAIGTPVGTIKKTRGRPAKLPRSERWW